MSKQTLDNYATVKQIATRLKLHPVTVSRLLRKGDLRGFKFHGTWLMDRLELESVVNQRGMKFVER